MLQQFLHCGVFKVLHAQGDDEMKEEVAECVHEFPVEEHEKVAETQRATDQVHQGAGNVLPRGRENSHASAAEHEVVMPDGPVQLFDATVIHHRLGRRPLRHGGRFVDGRGA